MQKIKFLVLLSLTLFFITSCKVISGDSGGQFYGATDPGIRSESFAPVIMASVHPTPTTGTALNVAVNTRKTYTVAIVMLIHQDLDPAGEVALRNIAKLQNMRLHLLNQFINSTSGKGALTVDSDIKVLSVPSPFYSVSNSDLMISTTQAHIRDRFYASYADSYDFLAVYTDYNSSLSWGSRHIEVTPTIGGLGRANDNWSDAESWGSAGRLKAVGMIADVNSLPETYDFENSKMNLVLHELFGHHWGVFIPELTSGGGHFSYDIESPNFSPMYGRPWVQDDPIHFECVNQTDASTGYYKVVFHPWILYHAGLLIKAEIPDQIMKMTLDQAPQGRYDIYSTTGSTILLDIDDIIASYGDRVDY
jgi:hypothetical protein